MKQKKIYNYFIFVLLGISLIVPNGFLIVKAEESSNEGAVSEPLSVDSSSVQFENTNVENSSAIEAEKTSVEQQLMESLDETESTITNIPEEHANEDKNDVEQQLTEAVNEEGITNIVIDEKVGAELNTQGPTSTTIQFEEIDDSEKENTITTIISDEPQKETDKDQLEQQLTNAIDETNSVETNIEEENLETTTTTVVENEEKEFNDKDFIDETTIGKIELVKGQILQSMAVLIKKVPKEFGDMLNETTTTTTTVINIQDSMPSASLVEQPEVGVGAGNVQEEETTTTTKEEVLDSTTTTTVEELTTTTETTMTTTTQEENNHEEPTSLFNIIKKFIFRSYVARAVEEETTTTTKEEVLDSTTTTTVEELMTTTETTMTTMPLIETSGSITIELPTVEVSNESKPVLEREL